MLSPCGMTLLNNKRGVSYLHNDMSEFWRHIYQANLEKYSWILYNFTYSKSNNKKNGSVMIGIRSVGAYYD